MVGDDNNHHHNNMMVHVPPWTLMDHDPFSPRSPNATIEDYAYFLRNDAALRRYLEDNNLVIPTPTRPVVRRGLGFEIWDEGCVEEEPVMERVESGRDLRVKMFEKLGKENGLGRVDPGAEGSSNPDVGWISELVK
ncbi:hypothetical protein HanHA300_Chr04g0137731 [Helianthus annuus]|nr:hypothetical protein HanHA300_Chr04g0137731 [Helianthus annuus]KAJ0757782.1 hypothetical protein HanLR1_Chr04g0142771 [Helianthus annuus]KAJ0761458.1 hypothetical protein HanOQP8_Chr04g0150101 [Helianthus annuus]